MFRPKRAMLLLLLLLSPRAVVGDEPIDRPTTFFGAVCPWPEVGAGGMGAVQGTDHAPGDGRPGIVPAPAPWPPEVLDVRIRSSLDGSMQPALYWAPEPVKGPIPLLVGLHTWSADYLQTSSLRYLEECRRRGWAFVHPSFRGPNVRGEACGSEAALADIRDAVAWATGRRAIDRRRIYLIGTSGGGHMALLVAAKWPDPWAAVSSWVPPADLARWHSETKRAGRKYFRDLEAVCGGPPGASEAVDREYRERSPVGLLAGARGLRIQIGAGIRDGHAGSVPVSHALRSFNELARANGEGERAIDEQHVEWIVREAKIPDELSAEVPEALAGAKRVLFQRDAGPARVTIFDGGHECDVKAAFAWLKSRKKPPATPVGPPSPHGSESKDTTR